MWTKLITGLVTGALIVLFSAFSSFAMTSIHTQEVRNQEQGKQVPVRFKGESGTAGSRLMNIVLAKIDDEFVYAQDGRKFQRSPRTKVIRNFGGSKLKIAELSFHGDTLVRVVIK